MDLRDSYPSIIYETNHYQEGTITVCQNFRRKNFELNDEPRVRGPIEISSVKNIKLEKENLNIP